MLTIAVVFLVSLVVASLFGYLVHRALHSPWLGPLYRSHMQHHLTMYPPGRLVSDEYRNVPWYNRGPVLFAFPMLMVLCAFCGLMWLLGLSLVSMAVFIVTVISFGFINDYVHDSFHLTRCWLQRFKSYLKLRNEHFVHHNDMTVNFSIVNMVWDKVFKTMKDA